MQDIIQGIKFTLTGKNIRSAMHVLFESGLFKKELPASVWIDNKERKTTPDWLTKQLEATKFEFSAKWDKIHQQSMRYYPGDPDRIWVSIERPVALSLLIATLEETPFALASFPPLYPDEWGRIAPDYYAPSFGSGHNPHGWACAIKGEEGHEQFVSRRWIEHGPWKAIKANNDLSFIQFHDLTADPATALKQAKPAHLHMGNSDEGGFIQPGYIFEYDIKGSYDPKTEKLNVTIFGQKLEPRQLLDYSAARKLQVLGKDQPLKRIAFIFIEEQEATPYLETLWLRDMECYAIIDGNEKQIHHV